MVKMKSLAYSKSLSTHSLANSMTLSTTAADKKGNNRWLGHSHLDLKDRQTYTTVLNPVISPILIVARFTLALCQSYDLHDI